MKIPFLEIISTDDNHLLFLIEDTLNSDEYKDLLSNYYEFWNITNSLIRSIENYFKFESLNSLTEAINLKKDAQKLYKFRVLDKGNGSIYSNIIHDPEYDYKSIIYDDGDKPVMTANMSFKDLLKAQKVQEIINNKETKFLTVEEVLPTKPGRGQKSCKNCKKVIGARSNECKYCGFSYK